jgi:acyl-CoA oxidase
MPDAHPSSGSSYEGENFVLDQQVLRAALKSFRALFASKPAPTAASLSPSSYYLRLLLDGKLVPPQLTAESWEQPETAILLLEWRAALIVHEIAQTIADPDASATQRVSKAVTEAFVAARVGEMVVALGTVLPQREGAIVKKLYTLVRRNSSFWADKN